MYVTSFVYIYVDINHNNGRCVCWDILTCTCNLLFGLHLTVFVLHLSILFKIVLLYLGYVVPSELTSPIEDTHDNDGT